MVDQSSSSKTETAKRKVKCLVVAHFILASVLAFFVLIALILHTVIMSYGVVRDHYETVIIWNQELYYLFSCFMSFVSGAIVSIWFFYSPKKFAIVVHLVSLIGTSVVICWCFSVCFQYTVLLSFVTGTSKKEPEGRGEPKAYTNHSSDDPSISVALLVFQWMIMCVWPIQSNSTFYSK